MKHTDGDMQVYESLATKEICIALHLVDYAKGWNVEKGSVQASPLKSINHSNQRRGSTFNKPIIAETEGNATHKVLSNPDKLCGGTLASNDWLVSIRELILLMPPGSYPGSYFEGASSGVCNL